MNHPTQHVIAIRPEPPGRYTAYIMGISELRATGTTEAEALEQATRLLTDWLASARLVQVTVPQPKVSATLPPGVGHDLDEAEHQLYLDEIRRYRQEVDERQCLDASSTPTT